MHNFNCILAKTHAEIAIKSSPVRKKFTDKLVSNIQTALGKNSLKAEKILKEAGRLIIFSSSPEKIFPLLGKVFGLHSFAFALKNESQELEEISKITVEIAKKEFSSGTFAVRANRTANVNYSSKDVENLAGKKILEAISSLKVNLTNPENEIFIEIRTSGVYFYTMLKSGLKGLPLGCEGNIAFYFQGEKNEPLAALLLMSRGCQLFPVVNKPSKEIEKTLDFLVQFNSYKKFSVWQESDINSLIENYNIKALATADVDLDKTNDFDENPNLPVFRPLAGLTEDIIQKKSMFFGV